MPKVSVVVPNYNHAMFLPRRLDSILGQTFQDFELILLDDCSTDESQSILREYASDPRVRLEFNATNSGSTFKQWNRGVRLAQGKYIWIAESDDYADERLLERLVSRLDSEPSAILCYCRSWRVSIDGKLSGFLDSYVSHLNPQKWTVDFLSDGFDECRKYLVRCNTILSASSVVFRKEIYSLVGGADEGLVLCGDWKTWASMALTGGAVAYVSEPLNYHRFHEMSVSEKTRTNGVWPVESLRVIGWIVSKLEVREDTRSRLCEELFPLWSPAVLNRRIPVGLRWTILKHAIALDRNAVRRLVRPALTAFRMTLARRWRSLRAAF